MGAPPLRRHSDCDYPAQFEPGQPELRAALTGTQEDTMGEWIDKAKGKGKEIAGVVTNDRSLEAEGKLDQAKGAVKGAFEKAKRVIQDKSEPKPRQ